METYGGNACFTYLLKRRMDLRYIPDNSSKNSLDRLNLQAMQEKKRLMPECIKWCSIYVI